MVFPNYVPSNDLFSQKNYLNYIKIDGVTTDDITVAFDLAAPDSGKGSSSYPIQDYGQAA
jgi:hypothetical protein